MKTDLIVLAVVAAGLACLVALALLGIAFLPGPREMTDDTPEATVYNFYLALDNEDYEKAYGYLCASDRAGVSLDEFRSKAVRCDHDISRVESQVRSIHGDRAYVTVQLTHSYSSGPLGRYEYMDEHTVTLDREEGAWRLEGLLSSYWWC